MDVAYTPMRDLRQVAHQKGAIMHVFSWGDGLYLTGIVLQILVSHYIISEKNS